MTFAPQINFFFDILVMVYDRVDNGDKISKENFGYCVHRGFGHIY